MIQEKEALEMLRWCSSAESASVLCVEVFGCVQEMAAGGLL